MTQADFTPLLDRLRAATAPRDLLKTGINADIALALGWRAEDDPEATPRALRDQGEFLRYWTSPEGTSNGWAPLAYTHSLDAALEAVRSHVPGTAIALTVHADGSATAALTGPALRQASGCTPAVALMIAFLETLQDCPDLLTARIAALS